jgi:hypothetical protein
VFLTLDHPQNINHKERDQFQGHHPPRRENRKETESVQEAATAAPEENQPSTAEAEVVN